MTRGAGRISGRAVEGRRDVQAELAGKGCSNGRADGAIRDDLLPTPDLERGDSEQIDRPDLVTEDRRIERLTSVA